MLTKQQCVDYQLPRTPIKESDRRKSGFEERHGEGATELDALEALHPGEMGDILQQAIGPYVDVDSYNALIEENRRIQLAIKEALQERLEQVMSDFSFDCKSNFNSYFSGVHQEKYKKMPKAKLIRERDDWLFDSKLSYINQLSRYKSHKGR